MKALQLVEPKHWKLIDIQEPPAPAAGEAVVRVHEVGICGTDYSGYLGKMPFYSYPRIPGHELGVEVVAVGEGVNNVQPGDRCSVEPYINCQQCYSCRSGHTNCCEHHQTLGVHCDGGMRPMFTLPARKLHISRKLSFEQLALVETLAIGCHAVERGAPKTGEIVLVIGAGPIGLSVVEFAKLSGARTVVMDTNERRLEFVRDSMKVPDTLLSKDVEENVKALETIGGGTLPQVVIDATGSHHSMSAALRYLSFAGRLVYVGVTSEELHFGHALMHRRELTLLASRNALSTDFSRIIQLIEDGKIDTNPWITHRAPLEEVQERFADWLNPANGVLKAVVSVGT
jgi:2-desacetyl-2-hydroxyethyl bacteriochlorophyllide A dehydrogenase